MLVVRRVKQEGIHAPICGVDAVGVVIIYEELHSQLIAPFAFRVVFFWGRAHVQGCIGNLVAVEPVFSNGPEELTASCNQVNFIPGLQEAA